MKYLPQVGWQVEEGDKGKGIPVKREQKVGCLQCEKNTGGQANSRNAKESTTNGKKWNDEVYTVGGGGSYRGNQIRQNSKFLDPQTCNKVRRTALGGLSQKKSRKEETGKKGRMFRESVRSLSKKG